MPLITISLYPGRTQQQKDDFAKAVTKSAVDILKTKENHVIVVFDENQKKIGLWQENNYKLSFYFIVLTTTHGKNCYCTIQSFNRQKSKSKKNSQLH